MARVLVDIAIVIRDGSILICQRKSDVALPGYWEFPGGKREAGETAQQCLDRELTEELGIRVRPIESLAPIDHDYPHAKVRLHPHLCAHTQGEARPIQCAEAIWVKPTELTTYRFPPANDPLIREVIARLANGAAP